MVIYDFELEYFFSCYTNFTLTYFIYECILEASIIVGFHKAFQWSVASVALLHILSFAFPFQLPLQFLLLF